MKHNPDEMNARTEIPAVDDAEAARLFELFRVAAERAQQTLAIEDGIVAGKAWREFLEEFCPVPSMVDFPDSETASDVEKIG